MRRHQRTRRTIVTGYWILSFFAIAGAAAWQFEWIKFEGAIPSLVKSGGAPQSEVAPQSPTAQLPVDDIAGDPAVFTDQSEPATGDQAYQGAALIGRTGSTPPGRLVPSANAEPQEAAAMPESFANAVERRATERQSATPTNFAGANGAAEIDTSRGGSNVSRIATPAPRKPLGSEQPEEWNGQGIIQQVSNEVEAGNELGASDSADPLGQSPISSNPSANLPREVKAIDAFIAVGKYLDAHRELSTLYWSRADLRSVITDRIETTSQSIYFSPQPHYMDPYIIKPNDQLRLIADKYKVPWEYLAKLNRIDATKIRPDQKLKVIKGPFSAVVDLSDFELTVHAHGYFVKRYPVGTGRDNATPLGKFTVLEKVKNPQYTDPNGKVIDPDDPSNPLGERWIDLGDSYGIHGTIDPDSIGKPESRGCIRMRGTDVEEVYDMLAKGSEVLIRQ